MNKELVEFNDSVFVLRNIRSIGEPRQIIDPARHLSDELKSKYRLKDCCRDEVYVARVDCGTYTEFLRAPTEEDARALADQLYDMVDSWRDDAVSEFEKFIESHNEPTP
jgi:hypothetical protein